MFNLDGIGRAPARLDFKKLENTCGHHIAMTGDAASAAADAYAVAAKAASAAADAAAAADAHYERMADKLIELIKAAPMMKETV